MKKDKGVKFGFDWFLRGGICVTVRPEGQLIGVLRSLPAALVAGGFCCPSQKNIGVRFPNLDDDEVVELWTKRNCGALKSEGDGMCSCHELRDNFKVTLASRDPSERCAFIVETQ